MSRTGASLASAGVALLVTALLFPFYWTLVSSLAPEASLFAGPSVLPREIGLEHYRALLAEGTFLEALGNSLIVAGATTLLCLTVGTLCAYALARLQFRGKSPLLATVLAVSMFPQISIVSPLYLVLRELGQIDTRPGLVLPYLTFAMPLTIWLLVGFFRQLPRELEEAAMVDGASRLQALRYVVLPLALPGLATTAILTFIYCWNEFLFALSFTTRPQS
ncbi:MAG: carbohydrate ABC transporter permease, partial [Deltaproteobacteria bacterium]|nr:carbohydrate ABC transporter permease [Deltaproteobacteria bacterium]